MNREIELHRKLGLMWSLSALVTMRTGMKRRLTFSPKRPKCMLKQGGGFIWYSNRPRCPCAAMRGCARWVNMVAVYSIHCKCAHTRSSRLLCRKSGKTAGEGLL
eukprot:1139761-Pelagomonas_calceolata.AAC.2